MIYFLHPSEWKWFKAKADAGDAAAQHVMRYAKLVQKIPEGRR